MNTLPPPNVHLTADQAASLLASLRHLHTLHGPCDGATCPHARVIGELEKVVEPEEARKRERIRQQLHDLNGAIRYDGGKERAMTLLQQLEALAATEAKATKGPWNLNWGAILADGISTVVCQIPEGEDFLTSDKWQNDRALIADSRNLLKPLLALVKAQREALEQISHVPDEDFEDPGIYKARNIADAALELGNQEHP